MSTTAFSNYLASKVLNAACRKQAFSLESSWFALHTSSPTSTGNSATEVVGGGYVRKAADRTKWTTPSTLSIGYNSGVIWKNMPACTVTHISMWTALSGGNMTFWGPLPSAKTVASGGEFFINTLDFTISLTS